MNDFNFKKYKTECQTIKTNNNKLLVAFENWLKSAGLKEKTIQNHLNNINFYINNFLLYNDDEATPAEYGTLHISNFLGYWFIKKALWASKVTIKSNATSIKKFYSFLSEENKIDVEHLNTLKKTIKNRMPEWLATITRYDDPYIEDMEEVWFGQ